MTETVTSKYSLLYWVKIPAFLALVTLAIGLYINTALKDDGEQYMQNRYYAALLIGVVICWFAFVYLSAPKKITVSPDNIVYYYYFSKKQVVVNYYDIEKIRTVRVTKGVRLSTQSNCQKLEMELKNGKVYAFDDDDYDNYSTLKSAIYDHMWRRDNA